MTTETTARRPSQGRVAGSLDHRRGRLARLTPGVADVLLALLLAGLGLAEAWPGYVPVAERWGRVDWVGYAGPLVLTLASTVPLIWRRRAPLRVLLVVGTSMAGWQLLGRETTATFFAMFLAVFSAGAYAADRRRSIQAFGAFLGLVLLVWVSQVVMPTGDLDPWFLFMLTFIASIWLAGDLIRSRTARATELEERAADLERRRAIEAERAAAEERARIARELHDVIAHSMSVVVIQAAAAVAVIDEHPDEARRAIQQVETTARAAMSEMRRLLGVLRRDDQATLTTPQPGVERLPELVAELEPAGVDVRLDVRGEPRALPAAVDVSVYRIVQEALTNTVRHARARTATVTLDYGPDAVEVLVVDDGAGAPGDDGAGHGLIGMRERAELFGGSFEAGPRPEGGFGVRALLPAPPAGTTPS